MIGVARHDRRSHGPRPVSGRKAGGSPDVEQAHGAPIVRLNGILTADIARVWYHGQQRELTAPVIRVGLDQRQMVASE